jgi:hypothetical protein
MFPPCNCLLLFLEAVQFYTAVNATFQPLSTVLLSKYVPSELIMSGICKTNALIWFPFHQAFSWLAQHCLVYFLAKKDPVTRTFFTNLKFINEAEIQTPGYLW